jgi:hypothetical protein
VDEIQDWLKILWLPFAAVGTWIAWVSYKVWTHEERVRVLEETLEATLKDFKATLAGSIGDLRDAVDELAKRGQAGRERLYEHIDDVRKELKADINRESDKRSH